MELPSTPHGLFQMYLMTSYLYYKRNESPIADEVYDAICQELLKVWDTFEHQHKHLITRDDLEAGTGYAIIYPKMVVSAANSWADKLLYGR